jgi:hypothetical protein
MKILLNNFFSFGIKMCPKLSNFLTIQKPYNVDRISVTNFAALIKPNVFDGSNYKHWREWLISWLTAMNLMHVTKGKPEQFTPEGVHSASDKTFLRLHYKCSC